MKKKVLEAAHGRVENTYPESETKQGTAFPRNKLHALGQVISNHSPL